jgi:hypothetical protein
MSGSALGRIAPMNQLNYDMAEMLKAQRAFLVEKDI